MAIISFLTVYGQVTFTGVGAYHVIEVTPVTGTGLDMIYVIYNTNGVGMTYHSASGERAIWYSYDSRGADYAEEITCISCDSSVRFCPTLAISSWMATSAIVVGWSTMPTIIWNSMICSSVMMSRAR